MVGVFVCISCHEQCETVLCANLLGGRGLHVGLLYMYEYALECGMWNVECAPSIGCLDFIARLGEDCSRQFCTDQLVNGFTLCYCEGALPLANFSWVG